MRFFRWLVCACTLFSVGLSAAGHRQQGDDGAIVVRLPTESRLIPLYLAKFNRTESSFEKKHVSRLMGVLDFDLAHNGMTKIVSRGKEMEMLAGSVTFDAPRNVEAWKTRNIYYVVRGSVKGKNLNIEVLAVNQGTVQAINDIALTGDLSQDRVTMHRVADSIHYALFKTPGIASTKFLYTIKERPGDSQDATKWTSEVWEADYDGNNTRQITHDACLCVTPTYIPPKKGVSSCGALLYVSYKTGQPKIYMASLRDGKGRRFSPLPGNQLMPSISRQRDKVSFISDVTSNPDVFLQPFNPEVGALGKPRQIFTARYATQGSPVFSPDGKKVAFVSNKDGPPRIYIMDIPAPGAATKSIRPQLLTKRNRENSAPAWSPDGTKVAYCAKTGAWRQIWIANLITGEERQLTQGNGNKENPTWGPNSLHLIFNSASEEVSDLYLINLNQPEAVKISGGKGEKRFPCWEPVTSM